MISNVFSMKNNLRFLGILFGLFLIFIIFATPSNAVRAPIQIEPENTKILYYGNITLYWETTPADADTHHYALDVRDLDTNQLIISNQNMGTNTSFTLTTNMILNWRTYRWCVSAVSSTGAVAYADYKTFSTGEATANSEAHLFWGAYTPRSGVADLRYYIDTPSNPRGALYIAGANSWNGITNKVRLSNNATNAHLAILERTTTVNGLLGYAQRFNGLNIIISDADLTTNWTDVWCYVYENQIAALGLSDNFRQSNVAHEVGHALSLAHTNRDVNISRPNGTGRHIMDQGSVLPVFQSNMDILHLRMKWGM